MVHYDFVLYALHTIPSRCRIEYAASFPDNQLSSRNVAENPYNTVVLYCMITNNTPFYYL